MSAEPLTPEMASLLRAAFPGEEARYFAPMIVGDDPATADRGAEAILSGVKTATSSGFWDWPDGHIPFVGALCLLLDGQRRPRAVIETTRVEVMPIGDADEALARAYGEGERTLDWFFREIGAYYRREAARRGVEFTDATPLIFEWLAVARRL